MEKETTLSRIYTYVEAKNRILDRGYKVDFNDPQVKKFQDMERMDQAVQIRNRSQYERKM